MATPPPIQSFRIDDDDNDQPIKPNNVTNQPPKRTVNYGRPTPPPEPPRDEKPHKSGGGDGVGGLASHRVLLWIILVLLLAIIGLGIWFAVNTQNNDAAIEAERTAREAAELTMQQELANSEFDGLEQQFSDIENPRDMIVNDSVRLRLTEKYEAARLQVENLQRQLAEAKKKIATGKPEDKAAASAEIAKLRAEIGTLRDLLKHYVAEIDRLNKENQELRTELTVAKERNDELSDRVVETSRENEHLVKRVTLAGKLNVTGVTMTALNAKGKNEKKIEKAKQLRISFTIPANVTAEPGNKTVYVRITTPEGQTLDGGGSFTFEGSHLQCSTKKTVEYDGQEVPGITIYYDVRSALNPGNYTVELFADNYRLASRTFNL